MDGRDCVSLVHGGHDQRTSGVIGDTLAILHGAHEGPAPESLTSLDARFGELFDACERPGIGPLFSRAAEAARELLADSLDEAVLHGDLHHENVMHSSERGWLAIDAEGLRGETTHDGAMVVPDPKGVDGLVEAPERIRGIVAILAGTMGVRDRRLMRFAFAHACLGAGWSMETEIFSSAPALRMARIIEPML